MKLNNFNIVLPGLGIYKVDFEIRNTLLTENGIEFGGVLTSEEKGFDRSFRKYLLLNSNFDLEKEPDAFRSIISNYRDFGPLIRMVPVQTNEQFEEILKRRLSAYRAANKVDSDQGWQEMRDEYDKNAINYSIQIGTTVVGTIRIIFSENGSRFPFEEYFKWDSNPLLQKSERSQVAEISRLAIDPVFQGSDIFLIAFRNIIVEIGQKRIAHPVCLATDDVAVHYKRIGAIKIGGPFPHKVMKNSDLNFYLFDPTRIVAGKMGALGWFKVAKPAVHHLFKYGFIKRPALGFLNTLLLPFEAISFLARRKLSKIRRSVRSGRAAK